MSTAHSRADRPTQPPPRRTGPAADTAPTAAAGAVQPAASVLTPEILAPAIVVVMGTIMTILDATVAGAGWAG